MVNYGLQSKKGKKVFQIPDVTQIYPSIKTDTKIEFLEILAKDTSEENRSWRPLSSVNDRYLSLEILDLPFLSPFLQPMVLNGLGCLEE